MLVMQVLSTDIPLISLVTILTNSVVSTLLNWHKCENVQNMLRFLYTSCFPNQRTSDTSNLTCKYLTVGNWLARKLFEKFTSEISPWYENNMKSYTASIRDKKFSRVPRSRLLTSQISVTGMFFPYEHNFPV